MWRTTRLFLAALLAAYGCGPAAGARPPIVDDPATGIRGDLLYHNYCSVCHGEHGDGRSRARNALVPPPRDFTTAQALSRDYMIAIVTNGKPGTAMVSWKTQLGEREVAAVVDYIRAAFVNPGGAPPAAPQGISGIEAHGGRARDVRPLPVPARIDMAQALPFGLRGDRRKGEAFYLANCATCHGAKGDGNGPRAYFINPRPRNFLETGSRTALNRPALYAAISMGRVGTEMPAWSKVLSDQEIADVAEFVFRRFIEPGNAPGNAK
jgi:mono/diheme cytochrome c family protein